MSKVKDKLTPETRARVYLWFARAFSYPDEERFGEMAALLEELSEWKDAPRLREWMEEVEKSKLQELEADYVTLFISGFPTTVAPPYESVYRDGMVMGASTDDVIEMYSKYQLEPAEESSLPDSLPIELEFVAFLLENYPDSEDLAYFFREHLVSWVYEFLDRVEKSEYAIYGNLASMLRDFLSEEDKLIP